MAEYCLECLNKLCEKPISPEEAEFSDKECLCSGCNSYKKVVICVNSKETLVKNKNLK